MQKSRIVQLNVEPLEDRRLMASVGHVTSFMYGSHTIHNGDTIDLAKLGSDHVTIVARTTGVVGSVKFSGNQIDNAAKFITRRSTLGGHTVSATTYRHDNAVGKGSTRKIHFTLIDSRLSAPKINSVSVIDNATGDVIETIKDGGSFDPFDLATTDVGLGVSASSATQSVSFNLDGKTAFDSSSPFATNGLNATALEATLIAPGAHTLVVTPFKGTVAGAAKTIHFTTLAPVVTAPQIASLTLVDAGTGKDIRPLVENDTIALKEFSTSGAFIRANISGSAKLVQFHLDSSSTLDLDTDPPFETGGPGSDALTLGKHTLVIKAFPGLSNSTGGGDPFTFDYSVTLAPLPV